MKTILLTLLFVVGCTENKCPTSKVKSEFIFEAKVKIKDGFYKGKIGELRDQSHSYYLYDEEACYVPKFTLYVPDIGTLEMDQENLELVK